MARETLARIGKLIGKARTWPICDDSGSAEVEPNRTVEILGVGQRPAIHRQNASRPAMSGHTSPKPAAFWAQRLT